MSFDSGKGGKLNNFAYELGWNLERRRTELSEEERKIKCTQYFKNAIAICKLFYRPLDEKAVRKHCEENGYDIN